MIRQRFELPPEAITESTPSPERIRELTAQIRKTWTPRQLRRRAGLARGLELMQMPLTPRRKGFWDDYLSS